MKLTNKKIQEDRPEITYGEGKTDLLYRGPFNKKINLLIKKGNKPTNKKIDPYVLTAAKIACARLGVSLLRKPTDKVVWKKGTKWICRNKATKPKTNKKIEKEISLTRKNIESKRIWSLDCWCYKCSSLFMTTDGGTQLFVCKHVKVTKSSKLPKV